MNPQTEEFESFVRSCWHEDNEAWFKHLSKAGWLGADWPTVHGGPGWNRKEQLNFIVTLANARCPLMPQSVSVIAPLLFSFGTQEQRHHCLPAILAAPQLYKLQLGEAESPGCILDAESKSIMLVDEQLHTEPLGRPGESEIMLATSYSTLFLLYENLLTLSHLESMQNYWDEDSPEINERSIKSAALSAQFLSNDSRKDKQIALNVSRHRLDLYSMLFQSLGYYALISPDPVLAGNEPVPFNNERRFLQALRQETERNTMIQQDQLFQTYLDEA